MFLLAVEAGAVTGVWPVLFMMSGAPRFGGASRQTPPTVPLSTPSGGRGVEQPKVRASLRARLCERWTGSQVRAHPSVHDGLLSSPNRCLKDGRVGCARSGPCAMWQETQPGVGRGEGPSPPAGQPVPVCALPEL